jgi:hypothetical protein
MTFASRSIVQRAVLTWRRLRVPLGSAVKGNGVGASVLAARASVATRGHAGAGAFSWKR